MQGISKSKHEHLVVALHQLEQLIFSKEGLKINIGAEQPADGNTDYQQVLRDAIHAREELQELYKSYNLTLENLAIVISRYETLYNHLRTGYVGKKLKELKRDMATNDEQFNLLKESIHTAYGT